MQPECVPGPRIGYGGFQFYSDWPFDEEQWRGIEPEADPDHIRRSVTLAQAFGAQHIKTRTFRRWDINARMITEAHRLGMRATGHCSHLLPLVAAGMDAKEHFGSCETRGNTYMYDDLVQLFRAADIAVVPTITYFDFAVRVNERPALLEEDQELKPFVPARENFGWMINLSAEARKDWAQDVQHAREATAKLLRAGVSYRHWHRHLASSDRGSHGVGTVSRGRSNSGAGDSCRHWWCRSHSRSGEESRDNRGGEVGGSGAARCESARRIFATRERYGASCSMGGLSIEMRY